MFEALDRLTVEATDRSGTQWWWRVESFEDHLGVPAYVGFELRSDQQKFGYRMRRTEFQKLVARDLGISHAVDNLRTVVENYDLLPRQRNASPPCHVCGQTGRVVQVAVTGAGPDGSDVYACVGAHRIDTRSRFEDVEG